MDTKNIDINENDNNQLITTSKELKKKIKAPKRNKGGFFRFFASFVRSVMKILWPTKIFGKANFPKDSKAIVICNHYSALDPCVIISRLMGKKGKVVMKEEVMKNSFVAKTALELGCIPIKRGEADMNAIKSILSALNNNQNVLIFPEGTRNRDGGKEMLEFKQGVATFAIKAKAPIVPLMYYKKTGPFKKNYLIVGKPFDLQAFYDQKTNLVKQEATEYIYDKMVELRQELDFIVEECKGSNKRYLKYIKNHAKELANECNGSQK